SQRSGVRIWDTAHGYVCQKNHNTRESARSGQRQSRPIDTAAPALTSPTTHLSCQLSVHEGRDHATPTHTIPIRPLTTTRFRSPPRKVGGAVLAGPGRRTRPPRDEFGDLASAQVPRHSARERSRPEPANSGKRDHTQERALARCRHLVAAEPRGSRAQGPRRAP